MRSPLITLSLLAVSAALAGACDARTGAGSNAALEHIAADNHRVAVAYRALAKAQGACMHQMRTGEIRNDDQAVGCLMDGLTASGLEPAIARFRNSVLAIGRSGSDDCRAAAGKLADAIADELGFIRATRADLLRDDSDAYDRDGMRAGEAAGREADPSGALLTACAED
jgi:hypothetical protein